MDEHDPHRCLRVYLDCLDCLSADDACADHAIAHGLPDRLKPLATGASARMLIYYFGTRDALLRAVLGRARLRQLDSFGELLRVRPGEPYTATLNRTWTITSPDGQPYLRMFGQLLESAEQQLWPNFRRTATTDWLGPLEDGLRSIGRPDLATLVPAVIRGLLMERDRRSSAHETEERTTPCFRQLAGRLPTVDRQHSPSHGHLTRPRRRSPEAGRRHPHLRRAPS